MASRVKGICSVSNEVLLAQLSLAATCDQMSSGVRMLKRRFEQFGKEEEFEVYVEISNGMYTLFEDFLDSVEPIMERLSEVNGQIDDTSTQVITHARSNGVSSLGQLDGDVLNEVIVGFADMLRSIANAIEDEPKRKLEKLMHMTASTLNEISPKASRSDVRFDLVLEGCEEMARVVDDSLGKLTSISETLRAGAASLMK